MKRKNNLYNNMLNYDNLLEVFQTVSKNSKNKNEIFNFSLTLNINLLYILELLKKEKYKFSKYYIFLIREPKYRIIMSERIYDKIVNHLVSKYVLIPALDSCLIDTNVATRKNKGSIYAFEKFKNYISKIGYNKKIYVLKIDINKYFYNIDHDLLVNKIRKKIKDEKAIQIIRNILNTTNNEYINRIIIELKENEINKLERFKELNKEKINTLNSLPLYKYKKGIPIGNMSSQIFAVFYLNDVDYYIKETLGFKYYIRYMDDLIILSDNKEKLIKSFNLIKNKIIEEKLEINKKSNIYCLNSGFSFLGYTFF